MRVHRTIPNDSTASATHAQNVGTSLIRHDIVSMNVTSLAILRQRTRTCAAGLSDESLAAEDRVTHVELLADLAYAGYSVRLVAVAGGAGGGAAAFEFFCGDRDRTAACS